MAWQFTGEPGDQGFGSAQDSPLVAIAGPTAAGKSALAVALAGQLSGEVVNYDSVQLYRGFDVGSGKLPPAERCGIVHHLLDYLDPDAVFTAGDYRRAALEILADLGTRGRLPVFVGGTGLYLRALLAGLFDGPARSEALRERLRGITDRRGREFLHRMLGRLDRAAAARIQPRDSQKLIRALEVRVVARQPLSALQARGREALKGFRVIKIGLNPPRELLYGRINRRVEQLFVGGLVEETEALLRHPRAAGIKPLSALGYRQARALLEGKCTRAQAVSDTQTATRHYAKRQMTWFRHEAEVIWFEGFGDDPQVQRRILEALGRSSVATDEAVWASPVAAS